MANQNQNGQSGQGQQTSRYEQPPTVADRGMNKNQNKQQPGNTPLEEEDEA